MVNRRVDKEIVIRGLEALGIDFKELCKVAVVRATSEQLVAGEANLDSLARTLATKYSKATKRGHLVQGLQLTLDALKKEEMNGHGSVFLLYIPGTGTEYFSVLLSERFSVIGVVRVLPKAGCGGEPGARIDS